MSAQDQRAKFKHRALGAEREAKLAAARAASTAADVNAVKREKSEVEIRLEEERMILEGCLLDANSERDALL